MQLVTIVISTNIQINISYINKRGDKHLHRVFIHNNAQSNVHVTTTIHLNKNNIIIGNAYRVTQYK